MGEGLLGKIFGKGKNTESGSVGGAVAEAVGARALGGLENAMTLKFKDGKSLNDPENENKICIEDNLIYELINQCTNGELDKKVKGTKNALGITSSLTISKDTLQKFREVIKNEDLAKALQMSGSVAQVASLGVLVVAVGMLKKANDQLGELNLSVSRISDFQDTQYEGTVKRLIGEIQRITKYQSEVLKDKDYRNRELINLKSQENKCVDLLIQADSAIKTEMVKERKFFKSYVDYTAHIEKWYQYQQILILLLRQISELTFTFNLGVVSRENSYSNYDMTLPEVITVRKELRDWHMKNIGFFNVDLKEKKHKRVGGVFDAAKRIPIGALANKISEDAISDEVIGLIENQTKENYEELAAASGNQFEEDVKMVVEAGKLYYVS
ncbi:MAG: hypothetical protein IKX68_08215 [Clostridiales bacterium]|nr:hypothetical protein [Clostridiales bacterium]